MRKMSHAALAAMVAFAAFAGCATYQEERDTTQPGKLQKSAFADGPWYTLRTVIDSPYEASFTFIGEAGSFEKIQWDIQEDYIYAYRTYEFVRGTDEAAKNEAGDRFRGEPVAAYKISSHFDLWHQYNPVTGEELPVLYEATERPWYEREYFRVDWSTNHIKSFSFMGSEICEITGLITKDPVAYAPNKPGDPLQVYYGVRDGGGAWSNHYDLTTTHELGKIDYIDVVNREFIHVNIAALFGSLMYSDAVSCLGYPTMPLSGDMQVTYRQSFMKVDPERFRQAEPVFYPDPAFERYGYFRDEFYTYDRDRGTTDFLGYQMHRWNIWEKTREYAADGSFTTIPPAQREIRPITYYINREAPDVYRQIAKNHLGKESWNRAFAGALKSVGHPSVANVADVRTAAADSLPTVFEVKDVEYTCGPSGDLACQQLGDVRYSFSYYVDRPSLGSPLGYGPSFSDPETGEIVMAVANFYGAALDTSKGYIGDLYDLVKGNITEGDVMTGENVRQYFQNAGNVMPPTFPQINLEADLREATRDATGPRPGEELAQRPELLALKHKLETMKRDPAARTSPYSLRSLAGTSIEKLLVEADHRTAIMNVPGAPSEMSEELLEQISPFRNGGLVHQYQKQMDFWSRGGGTRELRAGAAKNGCVIRADLYNDVSMAKIIDDAEAAIRERGLDDVAGTGDEREPTKDDVVDWITLHTFRGVQEHEVGHTLGLRHNFEGTYDEENYHDEYWDIVAAHPSPQLEDINNNGTIEESELAEYQAARIATKRAREAAGIDFYTYSSIMDYSMHFFYNDVKGIGKYDDAAIKFGYAGQVEVYTDPANKGPHKENRTDVPYFMGGQICDEATDCTETPEGFTVNGRVYRQQCRIGVSHADGVANLGSGIAIQTREELEARRAEFPWVTTGVCSDLYTELRLGEYEGWTSGTPIEPVAEPKHRFCSDERVGDRPFCNRYDEGKTAVEIVENTIEEYQRSYIFTNFRRYRLNFEPYFYFSRIMGRYFTPIGKIYQSMLYQLYYTPGFQVDPEKGFGDFLQASIIGLNFFGQVLATPDVGAYTSWADDTEEPLLEEDWRYGEIYNEDAAAFVPLGVGKHLWTEMEQGYYGAIYRYARMGTYWDKLMAIEALSTRDWGFPAANDETYPINFYDGFKPELLAMYGGMARDDARSYGPRVRLTEDGNTVDAIQYPNFWTGRFFDNDISDFGLNIQGPTGVGFPTPAPGEEWLQMDPGGSFILRLYSVIYSLAYFPVFYDNTFPGYVQLQVFNDSDLVDEEGLAEMAQHYSPKYRKLYAAPQTDDQSSFTHGMVQRAKGFADKRAYFLAHPNPADLMDHPRCQYAQTGEECRADLVRWAENEVENVETMLNFTFDITRSMGVVF